MTKLSDTQLVILGAAAQRATLSVLPLPDSLKLKGGALAKVMDSLRNRGLIRVLDTDGGPERVVITSEGMAAIGIEQEDDEAPTGASEPDAAPRPAEAGAAGGGPRRSRRAQRRSPAGRQRARGGARRAGSQAPRRAPARSRRR
jgi:hypothetical protein